MKLNTEMLIGRIGVIRVALSRLKELSALSREEFLIERETIKGPL